MLRKHPNPAASAIRFAWRKPRDGYRWIPQSGTGDAALVPVVVGGEFKEFEPRDGLFLEFARMRPERADIQSFANENGLLGIRAPGVYEEGAGLIREAESLSVWVNEMLNLRTCIALWKQIRERDVACLRVEIKGTRNKFEYCGKAWLGDDEGSEPSAREISVETDPKIFYSLNDDICAAAAIFLERSVNAQLNSVAIRLQSRGSSCGLVFTPNTLLAFLWLQFAEAISEGRALNQCHCGRAIGPRERTCSSKCRNELYFEKIHRARDLHSKGHTAHEIAHILTVRKTGGRSPTRIVQSWLREKRLLPRAKGQTSQRIK